MGEGGVYHTPTVTGCLVKKTEAKEQVHRLSNLSFPCLTLFQSPNYASKLPEHEAWRDMILVFLCFLPFRSRIMQLKKEGCFNKSKLSSRASYLLRENVMTVREDFLFSWREAQEKKTYFTHTFVYMYKYAHYEPVLISACTQKHTPPFLLIQRTKC